MVRRAFTLLELIVAIVIIGIVFATVPTLMQSNTKSLESSMLQESVFAIASKMQQILSYRWDENSLSSGDILIYANVVKVLGGDSDLDLSSSVMRVGHINQPLHRRFNSDTTIFATTALGKDAGEGADDYDDIDDFITTSGSLLVDEKVGAMGYKLPESDMNVSVKYVSDGFSVSSGVVNYDFPIADAGTSTNMKMIEVNTNSILMRTYSANIGEVDYYKRRME